MKKLSILILLTMLLGACTDEPVTEEVKPVTNIEDKTNEPTQEELNEKLKEDAVEIDFIKANGDEVEAKTKVKASGKITFVSDDGVSGGDFTLQTDEGEDHGVYNIVLMKTPELTIEKDMSVTIYGWYDGKDDSGMPQIVATIIE